VGLDCVEFVGFDLVGSEISTSAVVRIAGERTDAWTPSIA
jgi:hypothetical protein